MSFLLALGILTHFAVVIAEYHHQRCPCVMDHDEIGVSCSCYECAHSKYKTGSKFLAEGEVEMNGITRSALLLGPLEPPQSDIRGLDHNLCRNLPPSAKQYVPFRSFDAGAKGAFIPHDNFGNDEGRHSNNQKQIAWQKMVKGADGKDHYLNPAAAFHYWVEDAKNSMFSKEMKPGWIRAFDYVKKYVMKDDSLEDPCQIEGPFAVFTVCTYCLCSICPFPPILCTVPYILSPHILCVLFPSDLSLYITH